MKKILIIGILLLFLASCSNDDLNTSEIESSRIITISDSSQIGSRNIDIFNDNESEVDYDLSLMNSTMVYSQVYNMITNPSSYYGKKFRIKGNYVNNFFEPTNNYYHYVLVQDALACCKTGLEFVWNGSHSLNEYPNVDDEIIICGTFSSYEELGVKYNCIFID